MKWSYKYAIVSFWINKMHYFFQLGKWKSIILYTKCYPNLVDRNVNSCSYDVHELGALLSQKSSRSRRTVKPVNFWTQVSGYGLYGYVFLKLQSFKRLQFNFRLTFSVLLMSRHADTEDDEMLLDLHDLGGKEAVKVLKSQISSLSGIPCEFLFFFHVIYFFTVHNCILSLSISYINTLFFHLLISN